MGLRTRMIVIALAAAAGALLVVLIVAGPRLRARSLETARMSLFAEARLMARLVRPALAAGVSSDELDRLDIDSILEVAQPLCNTPAEYTAFIEKARSLRSTEYEVLVRLRSLASEEKVSLANFIKFNFKTLIGIL